MLGAVSAVSGDAFLLRLSADEQVWVSTSAIFTLESERVTLVCEREGLSRYTVPDPPVEGRCQSVPGQPENA